MKKQKFRHNGGNVFALALLSLVFLLGGFTSFSNMYRTTPAWLLIPLILLVPALLLAGQLEKRWVLSEQFAERMLVVTAGINIVSCLYYAGTTFSSNAPNLLLPLMPLGIAAVLYVHGTVLVRKLAVLSVVLLVLAIYVPTILTALGVYF